MISSAVTVPYSGVDATIFIRSPSAGIVFEIVEIRHVIESGRVGELDRILFGQDFRADQHETAREVARNFRRRGFDDHQQQFVLHPTTLEHLATHQ